MMMMTKIFAFSAIAVALASSVQAQQVPPIEEVEEAALAGDPYPIEDTIVTIKQIREALREACLADPVCTQTLAEDTYAEFGLPTPYTVEDPPTSREVYEMIFPQD